MKFILITFSIVVLIILAEAGVFTRKFDKAVLRRSLNNLAWALIIFTVLAILVGL